MPPRWPRCLTGKLSPVPTWCSGSGVLRDFPRLRWRGWNASRSAVYSGGRQRRLTGPSPAEPQAPHSAGKVIILELTDLQKRDLRETVIHEAGHLFLLRHFGGDGRAVLWLEDEETDSRTQSNVRGQLWVVRAPDWDARQHAAFGAAGLIAEVLYDDPDEVNFLDAIVYDERLSETDLLCFEPFEGGARGLHEGKADEAADLAASILRQGWDAFMASALELEQATMQIWREFDEWARAFENRGATSKG